MLHKSFIACFGSIFSSSCVARLCFGSFVLFDDLQKETRWKYRPSILTRRLRETRTFSTPRRWTRHWPVENFRDWGCHSGLMASHDAHQMCRSRTCVCTCTMWIYAIYIYLYYMYRSENFHILYRIYCLYIYNVHQFLYDHWNLRVPFFIEAWTSGMALGRHPNTPLMLGLPVAPRNFFW